jgi:hypothetical protein
MIFRKKTATENSKNTFVIDENSSVKSKRFILDALEYSCKLNKIRIVATSRKDFVEATFLSIKDGVIGQNVGEYVSYYNIKIHLHEVEVLCAYDLARIGDAIVDSNKYPLDKDTILVVCDQIEKTDDGFYKIKMGHGRRSDI